MAVYFHGNFGLNRSYMAGILKLALEDPSKKDAALAKPFGYGAPMASKYRRWLHKTGLTESGRPLRLTPVGAVVWENDPALTSMTTQWFMHWELTQDPERAEAWHFFAHEFLPQRTSFSRADLLDGLTEKLRVHSEKHFGPGSMLNKVIARKLIDCYTAEEALGRLLIIQKNGNRLVCGREVKNLGPWVSLAQLKRAYG
ncbi:DUF4007 family protein [bacterium]|nr:DUF4007 family protein [bacterium]